MPLTVSAAASELVLREETGGRAYYEAKCRGFEWPGGASGPTVAGFYDCGYVTESELHADWDGYLPPEAIAVLAEARGRTGAAAQAWVKANKHRVDIPYDLALKLYAAREQPKWIARVDAALPNCFALAPDALGALVSIALNRGCSFDLAGDRYREMRAIKAAMRDRRFEDIPAQIRSMARLWTGSLAARRQHEAALFDQGLAAMHGPDAKWASEGPTKDSIFTPLPAAARDCAEPVSVAPSMRSSTTGNTALLQGTAGVGLKADAIADAFTEVAQSASEFSLEAFAFALLRSPKFWIGLFLVASSAYVWLERRTKLITWGI